MAQWLGKEREAQLEFGLGYARDFVLALLLDYRSVILTDDQRECSRETWLVQLLD